MRGVIILALMVDSAWNFTCHQSAMLGCHMMERTICELYSSCGDEAGRIRGCEFESMPQEIRVAIVDSLLSILFKALPVVAIVVIPMALHWVWGWVVFLN